jgi:carboxyl-terminal processing protease
MKKLPIVFAFFFLFWSFQACKDPKEDTVTPILLSPGEEVNNWILDNMKFYYYWNDKIPTSPNTALAPEIFFNDLLYKFDRNLRPDGDRFSWINKSADALTAGLSGVSKTTGIEFVLYLKEAGSNDIYALVSYVLPDSPASKAGFKRGDILVKVNGQIPNRSNYQSLFFGLDNYNFTLGTFKNNVIEETNITKNVVAIELQENPILLDTILVKDSKKVGYLVYNQFVAGKLTNLQTGANDGSFDNQLAGIFSDFKAKGITDMVLDLRYNPGGSINAANLLASLIGKNVDNSKTFVQLNYNKIYGDELKKRGGDNFNKLLFLNRGENIGNQISKVYIIVSKRSASASELVINSLKPFMSVTLIGDTTVGKNVGSVTIKDDTKKIKYGLQPIVVKLANSSNQSDYTGGFVPEILIREGINLQPLGNSNEPLLAKALDQIIGGRWLRTRPYEPRIIGEEVDNSIRYKAGGSNVFIDK